MAGYIWFVSVVLFVVTTEASDRDICCGIDVTDFERFDRTTKNGIFRIQRLLDTTSGRRANTDTFVLVWHDEFKSEFLLTRGKRPGRCNVERYRNVQKQEEQGPYTPCSASERLFPTTREFQDIIYQSPTYNLVVFYRCVEGSRRRNGRCARELAGIQTRTLTITRRELRLAANILRKFGVKLGELDVLDPSSLKCRLPRQVRRSARTQRRYY